LLDFYKNNTPVLLNTRGYQLISDGKKLLSEEIKKLIKTTFTKKIVNTDYLKPLINFKKPVNIFTTNYDLCIETLCLQNDKTIYLLSYNLK
jgi:hypothetical protein